MVRGTHFSGDHDEQVRDIIEQRVPTDEAGSRSPDQNLRKSASISPRRISGLRFVLCLRFGLGARCLRLEKREDSALRVLDDSVSPRLLDLSCGNQDFTAALLQLLKGGLQFRH
jgi:hypothetical protein